MQQHRIWHQETFKLDIIKEAFHPTGTADLKKITGAPITTWWGLWWKATSESWSESSILFQIPYYFKYKQISEQRRRWDVKSLNAEIYTYILKRYTIRILKKSNINFIAYIIP